MNTINSETIVPEDIQENWQRIVNLLAELFEIPAALIMRLSYPDIEVFSASSNADNPYHPVDSEHFDGSGLYCETVIKTGKQLLVPDALADENWRNNPDVKLNMISYLGMPIFHPTGKPFGTICVLDRKNNAYSSAKMELLSQFKEIIESHLEIIYLNQRLGDKNKRLGDYLQELQALRGMVHVCSNCKSIQNPEGDWLPVETYLINHPEADFSHGLCPACMKTLYPDLTADS
jgi:GAF domain-containing protein